MQRRSHIDQSARILLYAFPALVFLAVLIALMKLPEHRVFFDQDDAIFAIDMTNAVRGQQTLGISSRFGFSHPGPMNYYLLAPIYLLMGQRDKALWIGAFIINSGYIFLFNCCLLRWAGGLHAIIASLCLWTYITYVAGIDSLWQFMILRSPFLPFIVAALLCAGVVAGHVRALPALAFTLCLISQSHVSFVPISLVLACVAATFAAVGTLLTSAAGRVPARSNWLWIAGSVALAVLLWTPPLTEEFTYRGRGNLSKLVAFFTSDHTPKAGLARAVQAFAELTSASLQGLTGTVHAASVLPVELASGRTADLAPWVWIMCMLVSAASLCAVSYRRQRFLASSAAVSVVMTVGSIISIANVRGPLYAYNVLWISLVVLHWIITMLVASVTLLWRLSSSRTLFDIVRLPAARFMAPVVYVLVCMLLSVPAFKDADANFAALARQHSDVKELSLAVAAYLRSHAARRLTVVVSRSVWPLGFGVLAELYRQGIPFYVEDWYQTIFCHAVPPRGNAENVTLSLAEEAGAALPPARMIARNGDIVAFASGKMVQGAALPFTIKWHPWGSGSARLSSDREEVASAALTDAALIGTPGLQAGSYRMQVCMSWDVEGPATGAAHVSLHGIKKLIDIPTSAAEHSCQSVDFQVQSSLGAQISFGLGGWSQGKGWIRMERITLYPLISVDE